MKINSLIASQKQDWLSDEKLKPENGGSYSKLSVHESFLLEKHIESTTYTRVIDMCAYGETQFSVCYTLSGMTKWLKAHCFSYKQPKAMPVKVDVAQQEAFNEPIVFMDSAHPTMATKVVCGWIRKGKDKPLLKTGAKTRVNVMGAIELSTMKVVSARPEQVNSETPVAFFEQLKTAYPDAQKIHIILDNAGYHCSQRVKDAALEKAIVLHYLPPYSPNLNPIERLWKVMNERVRNNRFFSSAKEFRGAIAEFFDSTLAKIAPFLISGVELTIISKPSNPDLQVE